jgi:ElaB/YqjD/DUF883 family membrane-anchored ribosome-binding protein
MSSRTQDSTDAPRTVDEARDAVEQSRQRISSTLDQLEGRIVDKKHELQDRADVLRPVRVRIAEHPFTAVMVGVGVGALLGSLGGGSDDDRPHRARRSGRGLDLSQDDRADLRRWRKARRERLQSISRVDRSDHDSDDRGDDDRGDDDRFHLGALKHQLMGAVTSAITAAVTSRVREFARHNISQLTGDGRSDDRSTAYR